MSRTRKRALFIGLVITVVLGIVFIKYSDVYKVADSWKDYRGSGISFKYPASWKMNLCGKSADEIMLPSTIKGEYESRHYNDRDNPVSRRNLQIAGFSGLECVGGSASFREDEGTQRNCSEEKDTATLSNGITVNYSIDNEQNVTRIYISEPSCSLRSLFTLYFRDPSEEGNAREEHGQYGSGMVQKDYLLKSPQYKDIVKFAESIKIKDN